MMRNNARGGNDYIHRKSVNPPPLIFTLWVVGPILLVVLLPFAYIEEIFGKDALQYSLYGLGGLIVGAFILFRIIKGYWPLQRPWKHELRD